MPQPILCLVGLLLASSAVQAQLPLAPFRGTDISYTVKTEIDMRDPKDLPRGLGNAYLKAFVTLKNTGNERRKLVLCLTGKSIPQDGGRRNPVRGVKLVFDAQAKQFTCEPDEELATRKRPRYGNMGCQPATLDAGAETVLTFLSGSSPGAQRNPTDPPPNANALAMQITGNQVVQDGNRRDINGAGLLAGHRMQTATATFGERSLYSVLDSWILQLLVLKDEAIDLGCMKRADVDIKPGEADYTPPCSTPVDSTKACNKCFAMNTYMSKVDPPNNVMRSIATRDVSETVVEPPREVGWRLPIDPGAGGGAPRLLVLALTYLPGLGQPGHLLRHCDTAVPGCFATNPPAGTPFLVPTDGPVDDAVLTANLPSTLPSDFSADFFATYSDVATGEIVAESWLRLRPGTPCDFNEDGRVDRNDITLVFQSAGSVGGPEERFDVDRDGIVTVNDARVCTLRCTKAKCAP